VVAVRRWPFAQRPFSPYLASGSNAVERVGPKDYASRSGSAPAGSKAVGVTADWLGCGLHYGIGGCTEATFQGRRAPCASASYPREPPVEREADAPTAWALSFGPPRQVLRQQRKQSRTRYTDRCKWCPSCTLQGDAAEPCAPQSVLVLLNKEELPLVTSRCGATPSSTIIFIHASPSPAAITVHLHAAFRVI